MALHHEIDPNYPRPTDFARNPTMVEVKRYVWHKNGFEPPDPTFPDKRQHVVMAEDYARLERERDELADMFKDWQRAYHYVTDILPLGERTKFWARDGSAANAAEIDRDRVDNLIGERDAMAAEVARLQAVEGAANRVADVVSWPKFGNTEEHNALRELAEACGSVVIGDCTPSAADIEAAKTAIAATPEHLRDSP